MTGFTIYSNQSNETYAKDTYIKEGQDGTTYYNEATMKIGQTAGGLDYKALLEFNASTIPSGDTLVIATLQVYASAVANGNVTLQVRRLTSAWSEIGAGWGNRTESEIWEASGGDYPSTIYSTVQFANQSGIYYNFTITDLVKGWVNSSYDNYGLIIIAPSASNEIIEISSSASATEAQRPLFFVQHTPNAAPTISNFSITTNLTNPSKIGEQINFTATWSDLEGDTSQLFICNTSEATASGCTNGTFCSTSLASTNSVSCLYTITNNDNRTTNIWGFVCDNNNCSDANTSQFYINHPPEIKVKLPNGGELINITANPEGYTITFNFSDADSDNVNATLYYGSTQNSTTNLINSINLNSTYCTITGDNTATTPNNCNYNWNTTGIYGTYFLTIIANDSYHTANDSSDASFDVRSLTDTIAPNITAQWIESGTIYSGKSTQIYANISEPNIHTVWVSINGTSQTNYTMTNISSTTFNYTWTAEAVGNYTFKVWANDTIGNLNNSMSWTSFNVTKPNATAQDITAPSTTLPYHVIQVTGNLNATDPLKSVYAYLNVPNGFTFLSNYSQNNLLGNFTVNQTKTATWFLGNPLTESTYSLNITYTDGYSNTWNSSNTQIQVTSGIGGYEVSMTGSPEIAASETYYVEAYFKQSGTYTAPDSMNVIIYDSAGNTKASTAMTNEQTGIYNHTYAVGAAPMAGIWETIVNATKSGTSYYAHEFWKVVGALFDIRDITIIDAIVNDLNISVVLENIGNNPTDLELEWNLTRVDTGALLDGGSNTIGVGATPITAYITPSTTYVGQVKITFIGRYLDSEKAGAYEIFSTTSGGTSPPSTGGSGGGGGGASTVITPQNADFQVEDLEEIIYLTKNIEKIVRLSIKNTGEKTLTNLNIDITNLEDQYFTITPIKINSLAPGKTADFEVIYLITDFSGEKEINYAITTSETSKIVKTTLIVLSMRDYFLKELNLLLDKISSLKIRLQKINSQNLILDLENCEKITNSIGEDIEKEEFIDVKDNLKIAEACITEVENELEKEEKIPFFKKIAPEKWLWIVNWAFILLVITALVTIIYYLKKKSGLVNFMNKEKDPVKYKEIKEENIKEGLINEKLEKLKSKLGVDKKESK